MANQRRSRGRSKLGCSSCRTRRIKCDEQYPTCKNCSEKGMTCAGVRRVIFPSENVVELRSRRSSPMPSSPLVAQVNPFANRSPREIRAFKWLVARSANDATNAVDRNFWAKIVPRVAQADDMVWYGVAALSMLYEHPREDMTRIEPFTSPDSGDYYRRQALEWYGRSLQAAHKPTAPSAPILTLSAFIFACVEMLQGRPQVGLGLMHQAFQINKGDGVASAADMEVLEAVLPYLSRCLIPLSLFDFEISPDQRNRAKLRKSGHHASAESKVLHLMIDLHDITYQVERFCNAWAGVIPDASAITQKNAFLSQMLSWHKVVENSDLLQSVGETRRFLSQQLVVYHATFVCLKCLWDTSLDAPDPDEDHFRTIVAEAERCLAVVDLNERRIPFEFSVVPPLYYTAWACRKPRLRRKALSLLRDRAPREENIWPADACVALLEATIARDEGTDRYIPDIAEAEDVYPPIETRLPIAENVTRLQIVVRNMADIPQGRPCEGNNDRLSSSISKILPQTRWYG